MAFGDQVVIDDLSFDVRAGETFGLLGSNGSGKTTTIRALLGIYQPTAGSLLVEGRRFDPAQVVVCLSATSTTTPSFPTSRPLPTNT